MLYLFDINVLIARTDAAHEHHQSCVDWENRAGFPKIATCPLTENGFLRIYGHPKYPGGPGSPAEALLELNVIRSLSRHEFLADDISVADASCVSNLDAASPKQLTDIYLLALAVRHGGKFVTLDKAVTSDLVPGGSNSIELILVV